MNTSNPYKQMLAAAGGKGGKGKGVSLAETHSLAEEVASHLGLDGGSRGGGPSSPSLPSIDGNASGTSAHRRHFLAAEKEHKSRLKSQRRASKAVVAASKRRSGSKMIPASPIAAGRPGIRGAMAAGR